MKLFIFPRIIASLVYLFLVNEALAPRPKPTLVVNELKLTNT